MGQIHQNMFLSGPAEENRPVDHCQRGSHDCDVPQRALCSYTGGSAYICSCLPGFEGNGRVCRGEFTVLAFSVLRMMSHPKQMHCKCKRNCCMNTTYVWDCMPDRYVHLSQNEELLHSFSVCCTAVSPLPQTSVCPQSQLLSGKTGR